MIAPSEPPRPGRPRDPKVAVAIERAALDLVAELGFDAVSMDRIAATAGVGKPTIYRRWATKGDLIVEAIGHQLDRLDDPVDTGSLAGDLVALFGAGSLALDRSEGMAFRLTAELSGYPDLADAIRRHFARMSRRQADVVLGRAVARGELPAGVTPDPFVFDAAQALFLGRSAVTAAPIEASFVRRVVEDLLLPALVRPGPDPR